MKKYLPVAGRFFLAIYPLIAGIDKIIQWDMYKKEINDAGMPFVTFFHVSAMLLLILGSLSIIVGYKARWGAVALILFLIPASLIFHSDFEVKTQIVMFLKNISIFGGLILVASYGAGPISFDARKKSEKLPDFEGARL